MNNAGVGDNPGKPWEDVDGWKALIDVNFWGVSTASRVPARGCWRRARPAMVVNTGSKQGITTPPGNLAYNVSKAGAEPSPRRWRTSCATRRAPGQRASADPRLHLHRQRGAEAGRRMDAATRSSSSC